jgi:hypothetical protein
MLDLKAADEEGGTRFGLTRSRASRSSALGQSAMSAAGAIAARAGPRRAEPAFAHALRRAAPFWLIGPSQLLALLVIGYPGVRPDPDRDP